MAQATNSLSSRTKFAKRHYECIALAMQHAHVPQGIICDPAKRNQWESVRNELADMFARDNGQFKRDRFMHACEPGSNVRARNGGAR
jgi:hypothetical protein